jgi:hypothetical protein
MSEVKPMCPCGCGQTPKEGNTYVYRHNIYQYTRQTGEGHPRWKGGRYIRKDGYILTKAKGHPREDKDGYVMEHILVMEEYVGRYLWEWEIVHHKNGVKTDNGIENLRLYSSHSEHMKEHTDTRLRDVDTGRFVSQ